MPYSSTSSDVKYGAGGWIRTIEAHASDLQSDPFGRSGTPAGNWSAFCLRTQQLSIYFLNKFKQLAKQWRNNGAGERNRTPDRLITSQLLYLLSYASLYSHHRLWRRNFSEDFNYWQYLNTHFVVFRCNYFYQMRTL
jgi:hypothetical protein